MIVLLALALASADAADTSPKPFYEPGTPKPGESVDNRPIGPRDQWVKASIDIDRKGYPIRCRVTASNIRSSERRFWFCHAMMTDWHAAPVLEDGVPIATTVTRKMVLRGK